VLSIQSEVVRGHVGNGAARFALQRLGVDVLAVPTTLLSNHPGHGRFEGQAVASTLIASLLLGLNQHGWLASCSAAISGYLGNADQARVIADAIGLIKRASPSFLYLCDPVFGDDRGAYARPGVAESMARDLLPLADIAAPNRFELSSLTSRQIKGPRDAVAAARLLGVRETVVTSVPCPAGETGNVVVTCDGAWLCASPRLENVPSGTGDLLAAVYLAARLGGLAPDAALSRTSSCIHDIIEDSVAARADELTLVASQDLLVSPRRLVAALPLD